jgi:uncharacterized membrane protein YphA (DoxX/SURF4 family)
MRRLAARWLLALALVVAQLGIHAHALSHLGGALSGNDGGIHQTKHDPASCLAFQAAAAAAVGPSGFALGGEAPTAVAGLGSADPLLPSTALSRFASRAPPFHS